MGKVSCFGLMTVLVAFLLMAGCARETAVYSGGQIDLQKSIARLDGVYKRSADGNHYDYSKKKELEEILAGTSTRHAVNLLIECLDDTSPSASMLDGKPVSVGVVCYQGLVQSVYYEPTDQDGDVAGEWAGYITPKSSPRLMRKAKEAWEKAQEDNELVFQ